MLKLVIKLEFVCFAELLIFDLYFRLKIVSRTLSLAVVIVIAGVVVRLLGFRPDLRFNIQSLCVWLFLFIKIELNQRMG